MNKMDELDNKFCYVYSSSLEQKVQIKIGSLEGERHKPDYEKLLADPMLKFSGLYQDTCSDLMVICEVYADNQKLSLPIATSYKAFNNRWDWNEWVTLPINYCDLPRTAQLALTIYDCIGPDKTQPVGGTTISLFGKHGVFRQGMLDLRVWSGKKADGNTPTATPGKLKDTNKEQMQRLVKLRKKYKNGQITKVNWLDQRTFSEIEMIIKREKSISDHLYLMIEFPSIFVDGVQHDIVYYEPDGDDMFQFRSQGDMVRLPDNEIQQENLVESKHHKLARSLRSGVSDKDAKPNATVRDQLKDIVAYPPTTQLSNEEQDLVWKFRFYLSNQKKALTKFLKCVNWKVQSEVRQALHMLHRWAPMDVEDALELLSPNFSHPAVRRYAVSRLKQAPDEDLLLYLLQLVQALKYENFDEIKENYLRLTANKKDDDDNSNGSSILRRSNSVYSNIIEPSNRNNDGLQMSIDRADDKFNPKSNDSTNTILSDEDQTKMNNDETSCDDLASFLIHRACKNSTLANYFFWYLSLECEDHQENTPASIMIAKPASDVYDMYMTVMKTFSQTLANGNYEMQQRRTFLMRQQEFINKLVRLIKNIAKESGNRLKKQEYLQQFLKDKEMFKINFSDFDPIPLPLDPDVYIKGIVPEKATLFKSALMPSKLTFLTTDNTEYVAIFKHGDDLRQDQLILQMITLMDKLLRRENLDLKLTPYRVLATSTKHGFLQFIDSVTVAEVLRTEGTIQNYFRKHNPCESAPYGIAPDVMDTYVRSCAGYCVITYLLGVGDRHLDNLLLTRNGKLFHIDFGYILGRDPKPLPPPMKLSKEMVEAMGGINSEHYQEFRKQCYTAFLHLRRHANLMLNLFSLMVDASVPDIALEPDKAVRKVQDKLRLDLSDEEAVHYMQNLLDLSVTAVMAALVEQLHKFAQYWRK